MNNPMNNLQRAKEEARGKLDKKFRYGLQKQVNSNFDDCTPEVREMLDEIVTSTYLQAVEDCKMTADDVWKVGEHYWGGDYEPSHYELVKLSESYNDIMEKKLQSLKQTKDVNSLKQNQEDEFTACSNCCPNPCNHHND